MHVEEMNVSWAATNRGEWRLIDVRSQEEYTGPLGAAEGSELVPLETLETVAKGWSRSEKLAIICRSGARSMRAARYLKGQGYKDVVNVGGGMIAWNAENLPQR